MKLTDLFEGNTIADLQAELKKLNKELVDAKSGGNDAMVGRLRDDIRRTKEKIEDAKALKEGRYRHNDEMEKELGVEVDWDERIGDRYGPNSPLRADEKRKKDKKGKKKQSR